MTNEAGIEGDTPVFIPLSGSHMFGVLSRPRTASNRIGVLVASGATAAPCCGRNSFVTSLARELCDNGFHVLRFDYPGAGDSPGILSEPDFAKPLVEEVVAAHNWLLGLTEVDEVAIIGQCGGGFNALCASHRLEQLCGLAMTSPPLTPEPKRESIVRNTPVKELAGRWLQWKNVRRYLGPERKRYAQLVVRRLRMSMENRASRVSSALGWHGKPESSDSDFFERMEPLLEGETRILMLFGTQDAWYADFAAELESGRLAGLVRRHGKDQVRTGSVDGRLQNLTEIALQNELREALVSWLGDIGSTSDGSDTSGVGAGP